MAIFVMNDEWKYWHLAYQADPVRLARLDQAWGAAIDASIARQRAELDLVAPRGFRPSPFGDGTLVEFDWDNGPYPRPTTDEVAACLRTIVAPRESSDAGGLFEAVMSDCVTNFVNVGLGGLPTWLDLDFPRGLPSHPGVKGMDGWSTTWADAAAIRIWVAALRREVNDSENKLWNEAIDDDAPPLAPSALAMLDRLDVIAAAEGAVLSVCARNPFV